MISDFLSSTALSQPHYTGNTKLQRSLEKNLLRRSHRRLDVDDTNVLPLLLQERCQKVSSQLNVDNVFLLGKGDVSNCNVEAHNLLHLELNGRLDLVDFLLHIITWSEEGWELTRLGQSWSQKTWDLLDHVVGCEEEIVLLGKLLNELLVLVQLLQVLDGAVVD